MNRQELETAAQKAILENQHNLTAPVVVQIWKTRKLCIFPAYPFIEIVIFLILYQFTGELTRNDGGYLISRSPLVSPCQQGKIEELQYAKLCVRLWLPL
jgi:hypothetical protein